VNDVHAVRILLSDGSGLTARQVANRLAATSHRVEVLTGDLRALTRFTWHGHRIHRVPRYGADPFAWLESVLGVLDAPSVVGPVDVLLPTHEQVAVLALCSQEIRGRGVGLAVPTFAALSRVQSKVRAVQTLTEIGVPQPDSVVVRDREVLRHYNAFPAFVKLPIGTASSGVVRLPDREALHAFANGLDDDALSLGGLVVQREVEGPCAMVQCVFDDGRLVAWHANLRVRDGSRGGASHKRSVDLPEVRMHCEALGAVLGWYGALSLDVIVQDECGRSAVVIDVNPRLVEPVNAWRAGVDLVGALLEISLSGHPATQPSARVGVSTHQLLLAIVNAAGHGRRAVCRELKDALRHDGRYVASTEELTPTTGDWRASLPLAIAVAAALVGPATARRLSSGTVDNYALGAGGWRAMLDESARGCGAETPASMTHATGGRYCNGRCC